MATVINMPMPKPTIAPSIQSIEPADIWDQAIFVTANPPEVAPGPQPPVDSRDTEAQRGENYGDSSGKLFTMYITEAEKEGKEITEGWNAEADRILLFTGLFSTVVASFVIASYQNLSPNAIDTTNALLTQILISQQLGYNNSNGTLLTAQSNQPFQLSASTVRVNVMWSLSLVISLNCALYATLMQQWARQYQELSQRRGTPHRRARIRAFIFDGFRKFEFPTRAVTPITTLLHISVFLFFAGLVEFLIPIHTTVAYTTLGCIGIFALPYVILTILPTVSLQFAFGTPLSGITWRISQRSIYGFFRVIRSVEGRLHGLLLSLWDWTHRDVTGPLGPTKWREVLDDRIEKHRRWYSYGFRRSVELSATCAPPTVDAHALERTLIALDKDTEIEEFVASMPGFFDSHAVLDPASAILPLMSDHPTTDPILGIRIFDLLETCISGTSPLTEDKRKRRLRVCLRSLWCCAKAYDRERKTVPLPSYFRIVFASPDMTRRIQSEEDVASRVIGSCFGALVAKKLSADIRARRLRVNDEILVCLVSILGIESPEAMTLLGQTGAIELASIISLIFVDAGTLVRDTMPSDVQDVFKQTLQILSQSLLSQDSGDLAQIQVEQFHEIYSKAPRWLQYELQEILDWLPLLSSFPPSVF